MGIEIMRRWPMYLMFAVCILLVLSLLNSGSMLTELRNRAAEMATQLQECSKQQTSCMEESLRLLEQREGYISKLDDNDKLKTKLAADLKEYKSKVANSDIQLNSTLLDVQVCKTELESLKNLQLSRTGVIESLRLEKDTLTVQVADKKQKIEELEKEIEKLRSALTTKSASLAMSSKVTPAAQPPKLSPALSVQKPIHDPVFDNDAKEDIDDTNALNDAIDAHEFDPQL